MPPLMAQRPAAPRRSKLAIEGAIGAAGPGAQADVALIGQHLSPEVTPARRSRFTTLAGTAQGETSRGFRGFT